MDLAAGDLRVAVGRDQLLGGGGVQKIAQIPHDFSAPGALGSVFQDVVHSPHTGDGLCLLEPLRFSVFVKGSGVGRCYGSGRVRPRGDRDEIARQLESCLGVLFETSSGGCGGGDSAIGGARGRSAKSMRR